MVHDSSEIQGADIQPERTSSQDAHLTLDPYKDIDATPEELTGNDVLSWVDTFLARVKKTAAEKLSPETSSSAYYQTLVKILGLLKAKSPFKEWGEIEAACLKSALRELKSMDHIRDVMAVLKRFSALAHDLISEAQIQARLDAFNERPNFKTKMQFAAFQQRLAQLQYRVGKDDTPDECKQAFNMAKQIMVAILLNGGNQKMTERIGITLQGAQAQAALMKLFATNGYAIVLPDPRLNHKNKDIREQARKEVYSTEGKGSDFIAVSPDSEVFSIDSKGKINNDKPYVELTRFHPDTLKYLEAKLKRLEANITHPGLRSLLDTSPSNWTTSSWEIGAPVGRDHLTFIDFNDPDKMFKGIMSLIDTYGEPTQKAA